MGTAFALAPAAQAADFTVDDNADVNLGTCTGAANDCSLRDAVDQSNATGGPDRVLFQSGVTGSITLVNGELYLGDDVQILGPGAGALSVSGGNTDRIFNTDFATPRDITIAGLTLTDGYAQDEGGAVRNALSDLTIADAVIIGNRAYYTGGPGQARGGGIASLGGSLTIQRSSVSGNYAVAFAATGGGVYAEDTYPLTIADSTVSGNEIDGVVAIGAGIAAKYSGPVTVERSTISSNEAQGASAGIGGGIATGYTTGATMIERSTVSGNEASHAGGGIRSLYDQLQIRNSTVSTNEAYYEGGGISSEEGTVELTNSTVARNTAADASSEGGGAFLCNCSSATIRNSILADNSAADGADLQLSGGSPPDTTFSLIEAPVGGGAVNETVAGSNRLGVDPQLGPLAGNGGPTETHALAMTSPGVDAGSSFGETSDQRGLGRPFDFTALANSTAAGANGSDIGAFELQGANPVANNNNPFCHGQRATVVAVAGVKTQGTAGDDVIVGTASRDVVDGGGGNDVVCLRGGNDSVSGGEGDDLLLGGKDSDKLRGGAGDDTIRARRGNDRLRGGSGDDRAFGGLGDDNVAGGSGKDLLRGGDGDDIVNGVPEVDEKRHGGHGNDDRGGGKHGSKG